MSQTKWSDFALAVRTITALDPARNWIPYPHALKNPRSAQSTARLMRKRFPDLEINARNDVVLARVRHRAPQEARTA